MAVDLAAARRPRRVALRRLRDAVSLLSAGLLMSYILAVSFSLAIAAALFDPFDEDDDR